MSVPTYEARIRRYYQDFLPTRTEQLEDPETFFRELAEQINTQVIEVTDRLSAQTITPGEDYLIRVGKLNTAKTQAEELAFGELVYSIAPETDEDSEEPEEPAATMLTWQRDQAAIAERMAMDQDDDREAIEDWNAGHPHLQEMVTWLQSDHSGMDQEQMDNELEQVYARAQQARPAPAR